MFKAPSVLSNIQCLAHFPLQNSILNSPLTTISCKSFFLETLRKPRSKRNDYRTKVARLTSNIESLTHREVSGSKPRETETERDRPARSLDDDPECSPNVPSTMIRSPRMIDLDRIGDLENRIEVIRATVSREP